jgi:hypothetical protein
VIIVHEINEAPVLAMISNRVVHQGMTVAIPMTAIDADVPANTLSYSLGTAPSGATINATSGLFTWVTDAAAVDLTNSVTIIVTDDGTTPLSDTRTFSIAVVQAPRIESITYSGGGVELAWRSIPGAIYRVQYNNHFDGGAWLDVPGDVAATDLVSTKSETLPAATQRFYRLLVVP